MIFIFYLISLIHGQSCYVGGDCNVTCEHWYDYESDTVSFLQTRSGTGADEFNQFMSQATSIAASYGVLIPEHDILISHMTVQYLCCLSPEQFTDYISLISSQLKWAPFNVTFATVGCTTNSLIVWVDDNTQSELSKFVERIESLMIANGIPVNEPRSKEFPFHSTIGQVLGDYPVAEAVAAINKAIPVWNKDPIIIDSFTLLVPPYEFHSNQ